MHFGFNNQFIKVTRTRPIFQKFQKKLILFSFNLWGYDLIRKTYSGYEILLLTLERLGFT
jgi:hypothetical protein